MKKSNIVFRAIPAIALFGFLTLFIQAQEKEPVEWLSGFNSEVPAGSYTYRYTFDYFNKANCGIMVTAVKTDKKGSETKTQMEFYLPDIDENTIQFKPVSKYITVSMITKGSQKFIKEMEDGNIKGYVSGVEIYVDEVDKARSMVDAFRSHLKECRLQEKSWGSMKESLDWLAKNISKSVKSGTEYEQSFGYDAGKNYLVTLVRKSNDSKGNAVEEDFRFNLADIDPSKMAMNVSGKDLWIKLETKSSDDFIQATKNNEPQNYDDELDIYIPDLETARDILQALKYAVPLANPEYKSWSGVSQALDYLKTNLKDVQAGSYQVSQNFDYGAAAGSPVTYISSHTDSKGTTTEEKYQFYLPDLDPKVSVDVSGKEVKLELVTKEKQKLIKIFKNGEQQNYDDDLTIFSDNIESARELANALNYAILNTEDGLIKWTEAARASDWLTANTLSVTESGKTVEQKLAVDAGNNYKLTLTAIAKESSGDVEEINELYVSDLSKDNIILNISGKKIYVIAGTGKEKLIKVSKSGVQQSYVSSVDIFFEDTRSAQNYINALKFLATEIKPKTLNLTDEKSIMNSLSANLKSISTGSYVFDQALEAVDGNSCKWKVTVKQTDSKGVETEYIYEFNLADINAQSISTKVSGKEMTIAFETKGKQKLIKPYKNNEPQNFDYDFELYADDAQNARLLTEAIKFMVKKCGN